MEKTLKLIEEHTENLLFFGEVKQEHMGISMDSLFRYHAISKEDAKLIIQHLKKQFDL